MAVIRVADVMCRLAINYHGASLCVGISVNVLIARFK